MGCVQTLGRLFIISWSRQSLPPFCLSLIYEGPFHMWLRLTVGVHTYLLFHNILTPVGSPPHCLKGGPPCKAKTRGGFCKNVIQLNL